MSKQKSTRPTRPTTIRRAQHDKEHPFVITTKDIPQNRDMTYAARGMLWYLLSQPQDWEVIIADLQQQCGRDKVYALIDELRSFGHIRRPAPTRDDNGRWVWQPYEVYEYAVDPDTDDSPLPENTDMDLGSKPLPDSPDTVNPEIKQNTDSTDQLNNKLTPPHGAALKGKGKPTRKRDLMFEVVRWAWNNTSDGYTGKIKKLLSGKTTKRDGGNHHPWFATVTLTPEIVIAFRLWRDKTQREMPDSPETLAKRFEQFLGIPEFTQYIIAAAQRLELSVKSGQVFYTINWANPAQWPVIDETPGDEESDLDQIEDAETTGEAAPDLSKIAASMRFKK